jgi:hypothetical protein
VRAIAQLASTYAEWAGNARLYVNAQLANCWNDYPAAPVAAHPMWSFVRRRWNRLLVPYLTRSVSVTP